VPNMEKIIFKSSKKTGSYITYNDTYFLDISIIIQYSTETSLNQYILRNEIDNTVAFINTEKQLTIIQDTKMDNDYYLK
jgi:hypothetical protein